MFVLKFDLVINTANFSPHMPESPVWHFQSRPSTSVSPSHFQLSKHKHQQHTAGEKQVNALYVFEYA